MAKKDLLHGLTTVGERGQIVIPLGIRKALKIKHGDELFVLSRGRKIIIVPAREMEQFYRSILGHMASLRRTRRSRSTRS